MSNYKKKSKDDIDKKDIYNNLSYLQSTIRNTGIFITLGMSIYTFSNFYKLKYINFIFFHIIAICCFVISINETYLSYKLFNNFLLKNKKNTIYVEYLYLLKLIFFVNVMFIIIILYIIFKDIYKMLVV